MIAKKICLVFVVIFLAAQFVSSLGITPGRTSFNFESALSQEISFSVLNTENKNLNVVFAVSGDLAEYVVFSEPSASLLSSESSKSFSYFVNLPSRFDSPGMYEAEILVLEVAADRERVGATVGGSVAVASVLQVYVPYPNKYLDAEVNVIEDRSTLNFIVGAINRGKLDIVNAKATIDVFDSANTKIASLETNTDSFLSLERKDLVASWKPQVNPGKYEAVVTIRYDNEVTTVVKDFTVGEQFLDILEVNVRDFRLGDIAKFSSLVENRWSSPLRDVYLNILMYNAEGEVMADFKSPTYDVDPLSKSELVAYWDSAGVREGVYDGTLILKYGEKSTDRKVKMKIGTHNLEVVGFTGNVLVDSGEGGLNMNVILILVVGILVVANVIWFVLIRKILKKRK